MSLIDRYLDALDVAFARAGDIVPWPLHLSQVLPYCSDLEAADLHERMAGLSDDDVPLMFCGSSSPKTLLMDLVIGLKEAGIAAPERVAFTERVFDAMEALDHSDIFCADGRHLNRSPTEVEGLVRTADWVAVGEGPAGADPALARVAFRVSAAAHSLVWACFFYGWTDIGFITSGPYDTVAPDGRPVSLLVRDFVDLRPAALWPDATGNPFATGRILTLHDPSAELEMDVFNHLRHARGLLDTTVAWHVEMDGTSLATTADLADAAAELVAAVRRQHASVAALGETDLIARFVESRYYALRHWREHTGDPWRPPDEVYDRIGTWGPVGSGELESQDLVALRKAFDPRLDFAF